MKKKVIIGVVIGIVIFMVVMFIKIGSEFENLPYQEVKMSDVFDGYYEGSVSTSLIQVKVGLEVKDHKLIEVKLLQHDNGMGKAAEVIVDDMITQNTEQVDTISGATASSQVIKSAVNQALNKGVEK